MKSNKPLIIVFIISIIILLGYFVKTNNGFIKTNNGFIETTNNLIKQPNRPCYDGVLNNTDKVNDNNTLLGETPQLKQFSTFGSNLELFNKPTSSFYKKEPYVFLQQSIKEGSGGATTTATTPTTSAGETCKDYLNNDLYNSLFDKGNPKTIACQTNLNNLKRFPPGGSMPITPPLPGTPLPPPPPRASRTSTNYGPLQVSPPRSPRTPTSPPSSPLALPPPPLPRTKLHLRII